MHISGMFLECNIRLNGMLKLHDLLNSDDAAAICSGSPEGSFGSDMNMHDIAEDTISDI